MFLTGTHCVISPVRDADNFAFAGQAGDVVMVTMKSGVINPCGQIVDPDGVTIDEFCSSSNVGQIRVPLNQTGQYIIRVRDTGDNATGRYGLAFDRVSPPFSSEPPLTYDLPQSNMIDGVGDVDLYSFQGTVGDTVRFRVTDDSGNPDAVPCVTVFSPAGQSVRNLCNDIAAGSIVLDQTGTWSLRVEEEGAVPAIYAYTVVVECDGGPCTNPLRCNGQPVTIVGTGTDNIILGTAGRDVIVGLGGNDIIYGLDGNDIMCGGAGHDILLGGPDGDILLGDGGNDILFGEDGADSLDGGPGNDTLNGGPGNDRLNGGPGNDTLNGSLGNDQLNGSTQTDVCDGNLGVDTATACEAVVAVP
jgi:Ca2+-binding RTX toxin-like protein